MSTREDVELTRDDVDDVVGIAQTIERADEEKLTLAEMQEVGRELDIPDETIERAVGQLHTDRASAKTRAEVHARRMAALRAKALRVAAVALGGVAALLVVGWAYASSARTDLEVILADAGAKRAQFVSVKERQAGIEAEFRPRPPSPDRDAELLGAENRVRVERLRYDEVAAKYNVEAAQTFAGVAIHLYDLPARLPTSTEL